MREIRIYVEGGGRDANNKAALPRGFNGFLKDLKDLANSKGIKWKLVACGSRATAFDMFCDALRDNRGGLISVLLVDSEGPVDHVNDPWSHLLVRDRWRQPEGASDDDCHMMVQLMESWIVADVDTLAAYYGRDFNRNAIPRNNNVEAVPKAQVEDALKRATVRTSKGEYHKTRHAPELLERLRSGLVRNAASSCDRLFTIVTEKLDAMG